MTTIRKYSDTDFQPQHLSIEEMTDPFLVIDELFEKEDLPAYRDLLWRWLKVAATGSYSEELIGNGREDVFFMYESMKKLLEAAHIIRIARKQENPGNETSELILNLSNRELKELRA